MKRILTALALLMVTTLVVGCASVTPPPADMSQKTLQISTAGPFTLDKKGKLDISGKGFAPDTNIVLIFNAGDGVKSDLSDALKPEPKTDASGSWATTWSYGRMVSKKIIKAGSYTIDIVNEDYEKLSSVLVTFAK